MTVLGGINLGSGLFWENQIGHTGVDGQMARSRDGTPIVWEQEMGHRDFNLVSGATTGTLTGAALKQVSELASVPGGVYSLEHNGETRLVRFRTWEQPVIVAEPIAPREQMAVTDVYNNIAIKLQEA
jgi:hypothetical protein